MFILLGTITKASTERIVALITLALRVIEARRQLHDEFVFTYNGKPIMKLHNSAWKRVWQKADLPTEPGILNAGIICGRFTGVTECG